jgi:hypothetical protein
LLAGGRTIDDVRSFVGERWDDVCRWRELIRLQGDVALGFETSGRPTPPLPSPSGVCAALGLVRPRDNPPRRHNERTRWT